MRLKPTERLILFSLRVQPGQTLSQLAESTDTLHRYRLGESVRLLIAAGLVRQNDATPPTFNLSTEEHARFDRDCMRDDGATL